VNADVNGDGVVNNFDINGFNAVLLNGTSAVYAQYTWDAENRLIGSGPGGTPQAGDRKAEFGYDYLGRRIEKKVYTYQSNDWTLTEHRKFVWSGWLMLLELDGLSEDAVVRKYTWGLDLAGQAGALNSLEFAGGIGGLLAISDPNDPNDPNDLCGDFACLYDANGNVGQLMDLDEPNAAAAIVASYEYDPYGNLIAKAGTYADENPIRWSTKYWDAESGLGYWGYRYYDPRLGRWISRDPVGECGGKNLYGFASNEPAVHIDSLGHTVMGGPGETAPCPKDGRTPTIQPATPSPAPNPQPRPAPKPIPIKVKCWDPAAYNQCLAEKCVPARDRCQDRAERAHITLLALLDEDYWERMDDCADVTGLNKYFCEQLVHTWYTIMRGKLEADHALDLGLCELRYAVCKSGCHSGAYVWVDGPDCPPGMK
jgi:RHS repeat-associated protein